MSRIEELANRYRNHIAAPWQRNLVGEQRMIFVVYPPPDERKLRARLELFEMATIETGHKWKSFDFTKTFARWMSRLEYKEVYFEEPENLAIPLESEFPHFAAAKLRKVLTGEDVDSDTVVAVYGVASLYGFTKVSVVLKEVARDIRGRLVVFFPGEFENNNYRLLGARDGWNYLAIPITLYNGVND
ncbi:MAG: hypothetical protein ACUVTU_11155 [Desulfurispora sp.]|uniref:hypothetical protein n=1 Tax=Desulfurispora sp. TaxID=3014275 RepID=UPI004049A273